MPSLTDGFTGSEIVTRVKNYVGNSTSAFQTYIEQSLPLAEFRFCKLHDWNFLHKVGLSLTISNGTAEYDLATTTIGHYMSVGDVESIYDETNGVMLKKVELSQMRRFDPENDDGEADSTPQMWAPAGDNKIRLWPPTFETGTLKIDGKISPPALHTLTSSPEIPYKYQESFIEYVIAMALSRENDDRAPAKKQEALALIRMDIQDDMRQAADIENPRIKHMAEARFDGVGANVEAYLFGFLSDD